VCSTVALFSLIHINALVTELLSERENTAGALVSCVEMVSTENLSSVYKEQSWH